MSEALLAQNVQNTVERYANSTATDPIATTTETTIAFDAAVIGSPKGGEVFKFYSDISVNGQINAGGNGSTATSPIIFQSGNGTRHTIQKVSSSDGKSPCRLIDFAGGYFQFENLRFYQCGYSNLNDMGGVLQWNGSGLMNVHCVNTLFEGNKGSYGAVFHSANGLTLSGTYEMKDNHVSTSNIGGTVTSENRSVTLSGDGSIGKFSGNGALVNGALTNAHDIYAGTTVTIQDVGTYSFGGGIKAVGNVTIDKATVTFGENALITTPNLILQNGANVTFQPANLAGVTKLTNHTSLVLNTDADYILPNLSGTETTATITGGNITLNNTADSSYAGSMTATGKVVKTGTGTQTLTGAYSSAETHLNGGKLAFVLVKDPVTEKTPTVQLGEVCLNSGTLSINTPVVTQLTDKGIFVGEEGGTLNGLGSQRIVFLGGLYNAPGEKGGDLVLTGNSLICIGAGEDPSDFTGGIIVQGGRLNVLQSTLNNNVITLSNGTLQRSGETSMGGHGGEQTITSNILLAGDFGGIQCGWGNSFTIKSTIRNAAESPNAELRIMFDSGTVYLNGDIQITGALRINDAVKTDGSLPMTVGGLQGGTKTISGQTNRLDFENTGTSALTLNLPETRTATYDGTLSGGFSVVKTGLGTQVFSQSLTHTGGTTIQQGMIQLKNGATPGSALEIQSDGTLLMDLGNYDLRNTTLSGDGTILWTMASADQYSQAEFGDMSNWDGVFNFLFASDFTPTADDSFVIADVFPDMGTDFQWDSLLAPEMRYAWNLNPVNGGLVLGMDRAAVPEPGSWILLGLGLLGILGVSRFRKRG